MKQAQIEGVSTMFVLTQPPREGDGSGEREKDDRNKLKTKDENSA